MRKPPTGEPCAGEPHARFGGRGGATLPDPYHGEEIILKQQLIHIIGNTPFYFLMIELRQKLMQRIEVIEWKKKGETGIATTYQQTTNARRIRKTLRFENHG